LTVSCNFWVLSPPRDETQIKKETVRENFVEQVVNDPLLKQQKRLNALFDLEKAYNIHGSMTPQQILMWVTSLLKQFYLQIKAGEKTYQLELQNDFVSLTQRKNKNGKIYKDRRNLLNQQVPKNRVEDDLFLDDETRAKKAKKPFNTDLLDVGVKTDDDDEEQNLLKDTPPINTYTGMPPPPAPAVMINPSRCEFCGKCFANAPAEKGYRTTANKCRTAYTEKRSVKIEATVAKVESK